MAVASYAKAVASCARRRPWNPEALAAGVPVVTRDLPALREVLPRGAARVP